MLKLVLQIDDKQLDSLAEAIASRLRSTKTSVDTTDDDDDDSVSKEDIVDFVDDADIDKKELKAVLKEHDFKSVKHIDKDYENMEDLFNEIKELADDDTLKVGEEIELEDVEVGDEVTFVDEDGDELASGEVEKISKKFITINGDKVKVEDITTVKFGVSESDPDEDIDVEMVRQALQAYKKEFGNDEYKSTLKEYGIKKMKDLEDMDQDDLEKIYSEIVED